MTTESYNSRTGNTPGSTALATNSYIGELATPQSRLIAFLIDCAIFGASLGIGWLIWFIILSEKSTTPGHHLMGQLIVDATTGKPLARGKLVLREVLLKGIGQWILGSFLFFLNYIVDGAFLFTDKKRTVHDLIVGSQVIQRSNKTIVNKLGADEVDGWLSQ